MQFCTIPMLILPPIEILSTFFRLTVAMNLKRLFSKKLIACFLALFALSNIQLVAQDGKVLFNTKCASCHNVFKHTTGPALGGFQEKEN